MSQVGTNRVPRRIATACLAVIGALAIAHLALGPAAGTTSDQGVAGYVLLAVIYLVAGLYAWIGWMIVVRQPTNTIGWLLLVAPLLAMLAFTVGDYATIALVKHPGSPPFGIAAAWLDRWLIVPVLYVFVPIFLLFPNGRIPSRGWRPAVWIAIAAPVITIVSFALTPGRMTGAFADLTSVQVMNPLGVSFPGDPIQALTTVGAFASVLAAALALAAVFVRHRSSDRDLRQQTRWLMFVGAAAAVEFATALISGAVRGDDSWLSVAAFFAFLLTMIVGVPIACGIAILKYRLYDLDVVIRKTVLYGVLAGLLLLVFLAATWITTVLFASVSKGRLDLVAGIAIGVLVWPLRRLATRIADRVVYGGRATPYEVMTGFAARVGETYSTDDVLPRMAQVLASATGATSSQVLLRIGGELQVAATYGEPDGAPERFEVRHQGEELGALAVTMPANDPLDPAKEKLIHDLAAQAGPVLRNVRLLEELRASRQRLVVAQDEERRRIERNIHDGAQQQLVALAVQLKLAEQLVGRDPERERALLAQLGSQAGSALEDLRDLARGIYPPLLADQGLAAALEAQARKAAVPTSVDSDGVGRFDRDVEATVYFCTLEALNNVAKYAEATTARIRLARADGHLTFEVADDGHGFDPKATDYGTGLQGMADRLDAIGGGVTISSSPGKGTTVSGRVPVGGTTS